MNILCFYYSIIGNNI